MPENHPTRTNCQCQTCGSGFWLKPSKIARGCGKFCSWKCYAARMKVAHHATTHGDHDKREYKIWQGMKARCHSPRHRAYKHYGARGITVCERWANYETFLADMGRRPSPKHSIERIDNDQGYSPDNCRWATHTEQCRNTRRTLWATLDGVTKSVKEWCQIKRVHYDAVLARTTRLGMTIEEALTRPFEIQHRGRVENRHLRTVIATDFVPHVNTGGGHFVFTLECGHVCRARQCAGIPIQKRCPSCTYERAKKEREAA